MAPGASSPAFAGKARGDFVAVIGDLQLALIERGEQCEKRVLWKCLMECEISLPDVRSGPLQLLPNAVHPKVFRWIQLNGWARRT